MGSGSVGGERPPGVATRHIPGRAKRDPGPRGKRLRSCHLPWTPEHIRFASCVRGCGAGTAGPAAARDLDARLSYPTAEGRSGIRSKRNEGLDSRFRATSTEKVRMSATPDVRAGEGVIAKQ
jgi:hypothetical protein